VPPRGISSSGLSSLGCDPLDLGLIRCGRRELATEVREGGGQREQLREVLGLSARTRRLDSSLHPAASLVDSARLPGGLRSEQDGPRGLPRLLLRFEDLDRGFRFSERGVDAAGHAMALGQEQPDLSLARPVSRFLRVFDEIEGDPGHADRILGAEGIERLLHELPAILDRLPGHVGL
jgi:hypothetical protein